MTARLTHRFAPLALVTLMLGLSACAPIAIFDAGLAALDSQSVDTKLLLTAEGEEDCPDLSDPNADPDVYACQLIARLRYAALITTCEQYVIEHNACTAN